MIIKKLLLLFTILLVFNANLSAQNNFSFSTTKSEIQTTHELSDLKIDILNENIKKFYGSDIIEKMDFYILDDLKKENICDLDFFSFLGFYNDSLFVIFKMTEELPKDFKLNDENCLNSNFFESDSVQSMYFVRKSSPTSGGNIFGEAGIAVQNSYKDTYVIKLESTGISVFSPSHQQYVFITLSRPIIDNLHKNIIVHSDYVKDIKPSNIFTFSMYENFENLQKPKAPNDIKSLK